jgi:hypothetical protein
VSLRGGHLDQYSDYLREDIDIGLCLIRDLVRVAGAKTATMNAILEWRASLMPPLQRIREEARLGPLAFFGDIEALAKALD